MLKELIQIQVVLLAHYANIISELNIYLKRAEKLLKHKSRSLGVMRGLVNYLLLVTLWSTHSLRRGLSLWPGSNLLWFLHALHVRMHTHTQCHNSLVKP